MEIFKEKIALKKKIIAVKELHEKSQKKDFFIGFKQNHALQTLTIQIKKHA